MLLTGGRGSGKSTLAGQLAGLLGQGSAIPGISTFAVPGHAIILEEHATGQRTVIGRCDEQTGTDRSGCMKPVLDGLEGAGRAALLRLSEECAGTEWVSIDELGYVESGCASFCGAVHTLFERKRVLAVVRKQHTPFLDELRAREDVFVYDLDEPLLLIGAVLMASGCGRRFGGNKLLAELEHKTLIERTLEQTEEIFARRVCVTRCEEIAAICRDQGTDCVLHAFPGRNDTVRIGVQYLWNVLQGHRAPDGYVFCPADQPLLTHGTMETLALAFSQMRERDAIFRLSFEGRDGAPVLFGADYREELEGLPQGKGGSWLMKRYPSRIYRVEAASAWELADVDTPEDLARIRAGRLRNVAVHEDKVAEASGHDEQVEHLVGAEVLVSGIEQRKL